MIDKDIRKVCDARARALVERLYADGSRIADPDRFTRDAWVPMPRDYAVSVISRYLLLEEIAT